MAESFIGEIRMFAGNFAPLHWAFCDGQLVSTSQNQALFSLLGTIYGGDGRVTFGIPEMRGRLPMHQGDGPGLTPRMLGQRSGSEAVVLNTNELATHTHSLNASLNAADNSDAQGRVLSGSNGVPLYNNSPANPDAMWVSSIGDAGGSQAHTNLMPSLGINFIISLLGDYPQRN